MEFGGKTGLPTFDNGFLRTYFLLGRLFASDNAEIFRLKS